MTDEQSKIELANAWFEAQDVSKHDSETIPIFIYLAIEDPESCWELIQIIHNKNISDEVRGALAVGPLEDLLVYHPEQFFPRIKMLAMQDVKFKEMLSHVWLDGNDSPIWEEFYEVAGTSPPFPPGWNKELKETGSN